MSLIDRAPLMASGYTITLDSDPESHKWNAEVLGMPSLPFATVESLRDQVQALQPAAAFVAIPLTLTGAGTTIVSDLKARWPNMLLIALAPRAEDGAAPDAVANALLAGADDFLRKPYSSDELRTRFTARKTLLDKIAQTDRLIIGDSTLHLATREFIGPLGKMYLSPTELSILRSLLESEGQLVPRNTLKLRLWGDQSVSDNALDRHIHGVRSAIKTVSAKLKMRAVYGQGYLVEQQSDCGLLAS